MHALEYKKISKIRKISKTQKVYNFNVPLYESYVANGFVVHNCQNYMVSQEDKYFSSKDLLPQVIIDIALTKECKAVCFTYNEPIIYYEYILDLAKLCKENKIDLLLKTSAYAELPIWKKLCSLTNAMNIDWKGNEERYKTVAKVSGKSIVECIQFAIENIHTEISIPIYHDASVQEHEEFAEFMSSYPLVPLHLLRIYPAYRDIGCQVTSTPILKKIGDLYKKNSKHVYLQNMHDQVGFLDTFCPECNDLVASRVSLCTVVKKFSCCNCPIIKE